MTHLFIEKHRLDLDFFVHGMPAPQGSKRHLGNGIMVESSKRVKPWRTDVRETALKQMVEHGYESPPTGAIAATIFFYLPRPKGHYRTGKNAGRLRPSAPCHHFKRPDVDKLGRAILDALTGVCWADDAQLTVVTLGKYYTNRESPNPGVLIAIQQIGD